MREEYLINWFQNYLRHAFRGLNRYARFYHFPALNQGRYPIIAANLEQLVNLHWFLRDLFLEIFYANEGLDLLGDNGLPDRLRY